MIPKFCELRKISSRNPTRIIDGEYFYLKLVPTPSNHLKDLFHFNSLAEEFSVLQSPPGNFNLRGKCNRIMIFKSKMPLVASVTA